MWLWIKIDRAFLALKVEHSRNFSPVEFEPSPLLTFHISTPQHFCALPVDLTPRMTPNEKKIRNEKAAATRAENMEKERRESEQLAQETKGKQQNKRTMPILTEVVMNRGENGKAQSA